MAVYDRWHKEPADGDEACKCGKGRQKLYPGAEHGKGDRWQVRWRDPDSGRQRKRNFALLGPAAGELPDRNRHAAAFDKEIQGSIVRQDYTDPGAGSVPLRDYAEKWRKTRTHGESAARGLEQRLRLHVYEGEPGSGRTPRGGVAIGQHPVGLLARRPSMIAAWAASLPLAAGTKLLVLGDVSAVFAAAVEDGVAGRNPVRSKSVDKPGRPRSDREPFTAAEVAGIAAHMEAPFAVLPWLGAGTGMREMEMAALGADDVVRGKRPKVRVLRQLKRVDGRLCFGPLKNRAPHEVPVPGELLELLDAHTAAYPPVAVTLPWHEPGSKAHGDPVTVRLLLLEGAPLDRNAMAAAWRTGAGRWVKSQGLAVGKVSAARAARGYGIHRLRHTFASTQLRAGIDVVRVAAWLGDTVETVTKTYLHLMPDDHDGDEAGRAAGAAFLAACARSVPDPGVSGEFPQRTGA